jgi:hypothetical protein
MTRLDAGVVPVFVIIPVVVAMSFTSSISLLYIYELGFVVFGQGNQKNRGNWKYERYAIIP